MTQLFLAFAAIIPLLAPAFPAEAQQAKPVPAAKSAAPTSGVPKDRVLWDHWYTVTVNKVVRYEYYNDRAEVRKGRFVFTNKTWKQEEDYINEEQIGAFAEATPELTPLFFNFHSTYRSTETSVDGNVKDGILTVRIKKGDAERPLIRKSIPPKTFFSELFPIWLGMRLATFKEGQIYGFQTVLEDSLEAGFATVSGQVRKEQPDAFATSTRTTRLTVNYNDMKSTWWVDNLGAPLKIDMPLQKTVVERVSKDKAQAFLDDN